MESKPLVISELSPALNIKVIKTNQDLGMLEDFFHRVNEFGWDTETNMVPTLFKRKARTFQFGNRDEQYVVDLLHLAGSREDLEWQGQKKAPSWASEFVRVASIGLESDTQLKVGVNMQFDYEVSRWCLGMRPRNFYDCHLAEKVIYTGKVRFDSKTFWGMDNMVERYAHLVIDKSFQSTFDLETELTEEQIAYCALDVRLPFVVRAGQYSLLDSAKLRHVAEEIEFPAIPAFGDMKIAGFGVSKPKWIAQVDKVKAQVERDVEELDRHFIPVVGDKRLMAPSKERLDALESEWKNTPEIAPEDIIKLDELNAVVRAEKDPATRTLLKEGWMDAKAAAVAVQREIKAERRKAHSEERKKHTEWNKAVEKYQGNAAINYGSHPQILKALNAAGIDIDSTGDDVLKAYHLKNPLPILKALRDYRSTDKLFDTYGYNFLEKYVDPDTGRIHSNINQLGADSGRTSSNKPNTQNIVQDSDKDDLHYRECFVARPGYKIITRDYDGAELRIIAELSGEESWVDAFNAGYDVHSICAELIYGEEWKNGAEEGCAYYAHKQKCECKKHKALRNSVKAVSFGLAYGAEAPNIAEQLGCSREAAQEVLDRHRATFPKVHAMLAGVGEDSKRDLEVRTIAGRRRQFIKPNMNVARERCVKQFIEDEKDPNTITKRDIYRKFNGMLSSIEREGKNTPFQGGNADIAKRAFALMWPYLEPVYGAFFVNFVHDEFVVECPEENAEACNKFMGEMMEKAGSYYIKRVRMTSGGNIDDCWSK